MSSTYVSNQVHFVWSTAGRRELIHDSWSNNLFKYMGGICRKKKARLIAAGGIADHIHLYVSLPSTISLAELANAIKSNSSRWIHDNVKHARSFRWQEGYGAFSVSKSAETTMQTYVQNQVEHHKRKSFTDEFVALLRKHQIEFDERYLWG